MSWFPRCACHPVFGDTSPISQRESRGAFRGTWKNLNISDSSPCTWVDPPWHQATKALGVKPNDSMMVLNIGGFNEWPSLNSSYILHIGVIFVWLCLCLNAFPLVLICNGGRSQRRKGACCDSGFWRDHDLHLYHISMISNWLVLWAVSSFGVRNFSTNLPCWIRV